MQEIIKDLDSDYGSQIGWACVAWKDRDKEGHFEQRFFRWPKQKAEVASFIQARADESCCVWKPTALLVEARRAEALPSNILSFEIDQELSIVGKRLLKRIEDRVTLLRSGSKGHYHLKLYLDKDLSADDNAYWTKYLASAMGITGRADSGGKFNPHDLLRIVGTRNTKPDVLRDVTYRYRSSRTLPFRALRRMLSAYTAPGASMLEMRNIDRLEPPEDWYEEHCPEVVLKRMREEAGADRSEQTYAFVQLCKEEGLPPGYIVALALQHEPTRERNQYDEDRIIKDVVRCWNKGNRTAHEVDDAIFTTPELQFLYNEAKDRGISPHAALGTALIHAGLAVPPWFMIRGLSGEQMSVNLVVAITGPSGCGKGRSRIPILAVPPSYSIEGKYEEDVIEQPFSDAVTPQTPASGPAIAAMFVEMQAPVLGEDEKRSRGRPRHSELVQYAYARNILWSEVDTFNSFLGDTKDSMSAQIRQGWADEKLGTRTKGSDGQLTIEGGGKYRLMTSFDMQPERSGELMGQGAGGLLQRVLFLNAMDPNPRKRRVGEGPRRESKVRKMRLPNWHDEDGFFVSDEVLSILEKDSFERRYLGEDSHRNSIRLRVAALLSVMHGSTRVEMGWWEIAGAVMEHSDRVKQSCRAELSDMNKKLQLSAGKNSAVRDIAKEAARDIVKDRVREKIKRVLTEHDSMTQGRLRAKLSVYQRAVFPEVFASMLSDAEITLKGVQVRLK